MLTVGKILKTQRAKKNISLDEIEKEIRIRSKYLSAIENDDWSLFSSKVYISGIIKNYSKYLGLEPDKILAFFRRQYAMKEDVSFKRRLSVKYITPQTRKIIYFLTLIIIFGFIYYFGYQIKRFVSPPKVEILAPKEESFKNQDRVEIVGQTEKEAVVKIYGQRIYQNDRGIFTYNMPLKLGKNILEIQIIGANGKETKLQKSYYLDE